jgi:glycosyltransferase involved in cell wall biosynthesis
MEQALNRVSIVIPVYNDRRGLERALKSIFEQDKFDELVTEVLVCDGGSSDGTVELIEELAARDARVRLVPNPHKTVPYAMNVAIEAMRADFLLRVDTHATLAPDYLKASVKLFDRTDADVVGGAMRPYGASLRGSAVAWAMTNLIGSGGSAHHYADREGPSDTVYLGVFRREAFDRYGRFDTTFTRNQDDEFTARVIEGGGLVYLSPSLKSSYRTRDSIRQLAVQYFSYGLFKPAVLRKHPESVRPWHMGPPLVALAWCAIPFAVAAPAAGIPAVTHLLAVLWSCRSRHVKIWATRVVVVLAMHLAYGSGFVLSALGRSRYLSARVRDSRDLSVPPSDAVVGAQ